MKLPPFQYVRTAEIYTRDAFEETSPDMKLIRNHDLVVQLSEDNGYMFYIGGSPSLQHATLKSFEKEGFSTLFLQIIRKAQFEKCDYVRFF